jgi:hypothetical protein
MTVLDYDEEGNEYLYINSELDIDTSFMEFLGYVPLDSNHGILIEDSSIETWVKYKEEVK